MDKSGMIIAMMLAGLCSGCAVGPDFKPPSVSVPEHFSRAEAQESGALLPRLVDDAGFWHSFNDPQLTALIEQALAANNDLRIALSRYDSDAALLRESRFNLLPIITADAQAGQQRVSVDQSYGFPRGNTLYGAGISALWELDIYGRIRRNIEARRAKATARADDLQALQVSIVGELASAYFDMRGAQERLRVARANVDNQHETVHIVSSRLHAGRANEFDLLRARAQLETTQSLIPAMEVRIAVDEHRIAVLTGRPPEALITQLDAPGPLPALPARVDPDTPGNLLRRRPDVAAAEEQLHAATAQIGVATADLFPRVSLGGMIGTFAFGAGELFRSRSESNRVVLGIDWSFLDVGRVRARLAASRADAAGYLAQYQQTVLLALEDTENALVRYSRTRAEDFHLEQAAADSERAAQLAGVRYRAGGIGLYEMLDASRTQLQAQDAFADARTRSAIAAVALYKALAGGWPQQLPQRAELVSAYQSR